MMCFGPRDRKRVKTNHCVIVLLDDTQLVHELHPNSTGQDLLDVVIKHLNLLETSYFGLKYYPDDAAGQSHYAYAGPGQTRQHNWLHVDKSAIKQLRHISPMTVYFGVKFYASDPCKLAEEITRYQFFLQCKQDILHARLSVSFELAVELFGLAVQSELGDYDPQRHHEGYVSEFSFLPVQTLELEQRAAHFHRTRLVGQVPATAELNFLEKVKWLDLYGCELHPIQYDEGCHQDQYALGLNPTGVLVLRNKLKVASYPWPRIVKTKCQGRCFLMDVVEPAGECGLPGGGVAGKAKPSQAGTRRNRFGFRLADKEASKRLRWSIEEHQQFYYLINSSASLQQLARRQQQLAAQEQALGLKFGQRFRQSIRSAMNLGAHFQQQQQAHLAALQQREHEQKLRASIKSMVARSYQQADSREPPAVVRMPSRRYSNRSLPRPSASYSHQVAAANASGLPAASAATMVESQRQQAMLMMAGQFDQPQLQHFHHSAASKSQTLRPISSKEAARQRALGPNPYYQMMMAMVQQQQQQQASKARSQQPEVAILPPGQHIVRPSVYRASSLIDGINQLGSAQAQQAALREQHQPLLMQQFFDTPRPQQHNSDRPHHRRAHHQAGHESPRSTKSAMVSSTSQALKMASKKLAKQQAQLMYGLRAGDACESRPLLAYADPQSNLLPPSSTGLSVYSTGVNEQANFCGASVYSASASPRSLRKGPPLGPRHRSKSTGANLHTVHQRQLQQADGLMARQAGANTDSSKMLLATLPVPLQHQNLPPPDYNSGTSTPGAQSKAPSSSPKTPANGKLAAGFYLDGDDDDDQRPIGRPRANLRPHPPSSNRKFEPRGTSYDDEDDDYYCSRSDCSSIDDGGGGVGLGRRCATKAPNGVASRSDSSEWNAIRARRSDDFGGQARKQHNDLNNNERVVAQASQQVKNIANKQATPILLSMSTPPGGNANSKAVQLLNMQRQQLHSQSSDGATRTSDSAPSSTASSPKNVLGTGNSNESDEAKLTSAAKFHSSASQRHHTAADSTASNSTTTSGYYAASNSTGPASVDSDSVSGGGGDQSSLRQPRPHQIQQQQQLFNSRPSNWTPNSHNLLAAAALTGGGEGTRAKIALGVHGRSSPKNYGANRQVAGSNQQRKFYHLGEQHSERQQSDPKTSALQQQQWGQLEAQSAASSSLKYVSFDV